ncbi:MAG: MFS transporter, partial [SAR202 cluster bacterium]|nr:MFS transporter [SAR202 cluster bacterium]
MGFVLRLRRPNPGRVFYGWYITIAGACSNFLLIGIAVLGFGVFIEQFRQEFGWSVKAIALGFSLRSLETGLMSPLTGMMVDRFGPKRMAITGVIIVAIGLFMFSQARNLPVYYAASAILALGQSLGGFGAFTLAIMNWFNKKRGRAMGLINSGNGFGYFATLIMASMIQSIGWRETLIVLSATVLVVGIPLALVIRDRPEPYGLLPDGEQPTPEALELMKLEQGKPRRRSSGSGPGFEVSQVVRMPAFYLLCIAGALGGATQGAWVTFQIPHYQSAGFSIGVTGVLVAVYGLVQVPMRFGAGWLGDIVGRRR